MENIKLEAYLSNGVEKIVAGICKAAPMNPKAAAYMLQYMSYGSKARQLRSRSEEKGEHVPPFLIASITNECNLRCKGCYDRANREQREKEDVKCASMMTSGQWEDIFDQAAELGVQFVLLAGGEPLLRRDVLEAAGRQKRLLFPIFTNGTMLEEKYINLLSEHRNLIPVLSVEGGSRATDMRRGRGVYDKLKDVMERLRTKRILFGASVTVTQENAGEVTGDDFLEELENCGCKAVIYVEYVPADRSTAHLAPDAALRAKIEKRLNRLRAERTSILFLSFPGDEKSSGGCLAAGRGFFHINAWGGAEPCPFSPYSDTSLLSTSLKDALHSPLFLKLSTSGNLQMDHAGGCVLFEQEDQVKRLLEEVKS